MKKALVFGLSVLLLAGCGGSSTPSKTSTVTGTVYDVNLDPVIGAKVAGVGKDTTTTSASGAFALANQTEGFVRLTADVVKAGVAYHGSTVVYNSPGTQSGSTGIMVGPQNELGSIHGNVIDRGGVPVENASVFAYSNQGGTSQRAVTDKDGNYYLYDIIPGITYTVSATGQTYRSDTVSKSIVSKEDAVEDFTLGIGGTPTLSAPTNLSVVTYTSFVGAAAKSGQTSATDWVKRHLAKSSSRGVHTKSSSRAVGDLMLEAQLDWLYSPNSETQGYGIYRSRGNVSNPAGYDFFYDPLASTYFDNGNGLEPLSTYTYAVTSTSTNYPDNPSQTQSDLSNLATARLLDRLTIGTYNRATKTFNWSGGSGATDYIVYVFDEYPSVNRSVFASNEIAPTAGTSWVYSGPALVSGHTYYWFVLGLANADASRTISQVGSFKA